jgi:hypothetical protein
MSSENEGPPVSRYAWPDAHEIQGFARAIRTIQDDQAGFFALLSTVSYEDVDAAPTECYEFHFRDVNDLRTEPLLNLLPHRPNGAAADASPT